MTKRASKAKGTTTSSNSNSNRQKITSYFPPLHRPPPSGRGVEGTGATLTPAATATATAAEGPSLAEERGPRTVHTQALGVLGRVFGLPSFRPLQDEVVAAVLQGADAFVLMPTGMMYDV